METPRQSPRQTPRQTPCCREHACPEEKKTEADEQDALDADIKAIGNDIVKEVRKAKPVLAVLLHFFLCCLKKKKA
jgi:hypothetical protein